MNQSARDLLAFATAELGVHLTDPQRACLNIFAEELKKWNRKINLTAITDDLGIVVKHLVDSLTLLRVLGAHGRLLDIGSGGGFPCIPVKIALPDLDVLSVDAVAKKISFQKQAARLLSLVHFEAVHARAETLVDNHAGSFDWVVSRAFSDLSSFVTLAEPLLKRDGRIVAMKGRNAAQEVSASEGALAELGTRVEYSLDFLLPGSLDARSLIVIARIKDLPCGEQH